MVRARFGLLFAFAAALLAGGCAGTAPSGSQPGGPANNDPPAPTAPVGANGQPIATLCDLLSDQDFARVLGVTAKAPDTKSATMTSATCVYGQDIRLVVSVAGTADEATTTMQTALKSGPFTTKKQGPIGGVDESVYGTGDASVGLSLRRAKLVVTIVAPGKPADGEIKLVQLAGLLLSRAYALGT